MHRIRNYGSFLQAYALKKELEALALSVRFVDIETQPKAVRRQPFFSKLKKLDRYVLKRLSLRNKRDQVRAMHDRVQKEYLGLDAMEYSGRGCDAVVIGSDEIFNCESAGEFKITGARFGRISGVPRVISYAASCGYTDAEDLTAQDRKTVAEGLGALQAVSVRDENTARFVSDLSGREAPRHLDPVLIYGFEPELAAVSQDCLPKEPYMVVYAYHNRIHQKSEIKAIRAFAKKKHLKLISVGGIQAWCDDYAVLNPFEVLMYFKNADYVVTDTFHGTVMAAKFNKPFGVLVRDSNANKLNDLLSRLEIGTHKITDLAKLTAVLEQEHDYSACNRIIAAERQRAREYLRSQLLSEHGGS